MMMLRLPHIKLLKDKLQYMIKANTKDSNTAKYQTQTKLQTVSGVPDSKSITEEILAFTVHLEMDVQFPVP